MALLAHPGDCGREGRRISLPCNRINRLIRRQGERPWVDPLSLPHSDMAPSWSRSASCWPWLLGVRAVERNRGNALL